MKTTNFVVTKKIIGTIEDGVAWGLTGTSPSCYPRIIGKVDNKDASQRAFEDSIMLLAENILTLLRWETTYLKDEISLKEIEKNILLNIAKCRMGCIYSSDKNERLQFLNGEVRLRVGSQQYGKNYPIYYSSKNMIEGKGYRP